MKIALLARPDKAITPATTSSRPRVVYDLANGLTQLGHQVTTFGSGDSQVPGQLVAITPIALEQLPAVENAEYRKYSYLTLLTERAIALSDQFDVIHNHLFPEFIPLLAHDRFQAPLVTTIHTVIEPYMKEAFERFPTTNFVALSDRQRQLGSGINFINRVYNGIAIEEFSFNEAAGGYLLFFGRMKSYRNEQGEEIDPKGVTRAIKVAEITGEKLYIAGNVEDQAFYDQQIKPHLTDKIQFIGPVSPIGPITHQQKVELYRNAKAVLNPISWEEPFGLVMVEAMACGTPVISFNKGAASEIIADGQTGYLVDTIEAMASAVSRIPNLSRAACRNAVETRFTAQQMVRGYEQVYQKIMGNR